MLEDLFTFEQVDNKFVWNSGFDTSTNSFSGGSPFRHVENKSIQSREDPDQCDTFTGIIDGITGEPLYGTRHYVVSGETYEGTFSGGDGRRHCDSAIVKNIRLDPPPAIPTTMEEELAIATPYSQINFMSYEKANFYGKYVNDQPTFGTLVTDSYSYRGSFLNNRFHGLAAELVHSSGFRYKGEFQNGLFHGMGREYDPAIGEYQGEYRNGMKHGMGTFKEGSTEPVVQATAPPIAEETLKEYSFDTIHWDEDDHWDEDEDEDEDEHNCTNEGKQENVINCNSRRSLLLPKRYTYSGDYHCNHRQGEGTEWTTSGEIYAGQFLADHRHGHGSVKSNGVTYEGQWRSGAPIDGNGWRIIYPNGDMYCGHASNYQPHGYGIYMETNGSTYNGNWIDGQRHGKGIYTDSSSSPSRFAGEWRHDQSVHGQYIDEATDDINVVVETMKGAEISEQGERNPFARSVESVPSSRNPHWSTSWNQNSKLNTHVYPGGDTYWGDLDTETNQRNGYGVYVSKSTGCTYSGNFKDDMRHGYGILVHPQVGKYAGEFQQDKKHGLGTLILNDSSSYHGGFSHGVFNGEGTFCERNGSVYVGEWKAGLRDGEGMETMSDGSLYKGCFKNGKRDGSGTLLEKSTGRIIYRGMWRDGLYNGEGQLIERTKTTCSGINSVVIRWDGEFVNGKKHGYGVLRNECDKSVWKGVWSHGKPVSGKWRINYSSGGLYSGQAGAVEDGDQLDGDDVVVAFPSGFGTFQYSNGDVYIGEFDKGLRNGRGVCQFASGETWEGDWTDDCLDRDGEGVLTLVDGTIHEFHAG